MRFLIHSVHTASGTASGMVFESEDIHAALQKRARFYGDKKPSWEPVCWSILGSEPYSDTKLREAALKEGRMIVKDPVTGQYRALGVPASASDAMEHAAHMADAMGMSLKDTTEPVREPLPHYKQRTPYDPFPGYVCEYTQAEYADNGMVTITKTRT